MDAYSLKVIQPVASFMEECHRASSMQSLIDFYWKVLGTVILAVESLFFLKGSKTMTIGWQSVYGRILEGRRGGGKGIERVREFLLAVTVVTSPLAKWNLRWEEGCF